MTARRRTPAPPRRRARGSQPAWLSLSKEELLDTPLRKLGLRVEATALETRIQRLYAELGQAGLRFRPYVYLSTDWFTPNGLTGFAVPFFLTHPRLMRIERKHMLEAEGGTHDWCMKLLRHEAAHAIDNAYRLRRRKRWREVFGRASEPYRSTYLPDPCSREYVLSLDYWYAQSHPSEDFAETFSIWLQPRSQWRRHYAGWPALAKLEYVDELMREIADRPPPLRTRARPDSLGSEHTTLRTYYRRKQAAYAYDYASEIDEPLHRLFTDDPGYVGRESAAHFLSRTRRELRMRVAHVTGQHQYAVDQVLNELILRCRSLRLKVAHSEREARVAAAVLLTSLTMSFLYGGHSEYRR